MPALVGVVAVGAAGIGETQKRHLSPMIELHTQKSIAAMRFKSKGGTRPDDIGTAKPTSESRMTQGFSVFIMGWGEPGLRPIHVGRKAAGR